ncbi:hypothetical protein HZS_3209, partial [Henneguya salminicola]
LCNLTRASKCCDHTTCKFRRIAYQCTTGKCCKNCRFISHKICGKANGECEKAKYCSGRSATCNITLYKKDYKRCNNKKGFCLEGNCMNMHTMCRQEYGSGIFFSHRKIDKVFYSVLCVQHLEKMINDSCPSPTNLKAFNYLLCGETSNICNHFVCGTSLSVNIKDTFNFDIGNRRCIIPKMTSGVRFSRRPTNYMFCGIDKDGTNNYCWNNICQNGMKGRKCQMGQCKDFMIVKSMSIISFYINSPAYESVLTMVNDTGLPVKDSGF